MNDRALRGLWQPPTDSFEPLAGVLRQHWRAAATSRPLRLFWSTTASWLRRPAAVAAITISRPAANSSDKPPDPRRC